MPLKIATPKLVGLNKSAVQGWLEDMATEDTPAYLIHERLVGGDYEMYFTFTDGGRLIGIVVTHLRGDTLVFVGAAGNVWNEWDTLHSQFVRLAKMKGKTKIEFRGRRGFLRAFKKYGMTEKYTVMELTI